jgi:Spy/CpxP family protein refolding chaperone
MNKLSQKIFILMIGLMLCLPSTAFAWGKGHKDNLIEKLDLKKETVQEIKKSMLGFKVRKNELKAQLENNHLKLQAELDKDNPNVGMISKFKKDIIQTKKEMLDIKIDHKLQLKKTLTPEQYKKLKKLRNKQYSKFRNKCKKRDKNNFQKSDKSPRRFK